jgi:hypothetical protein
MGREEGRDRMGREGKGIGNRWDGKREGKGRDGKKRAEGWDGKGEGKGRDGMGKKGKRKG